MRKDHFINNTYFFLWRLKTAFLKKVSSPVEHEYLFILSGAACGSTLLHEIISDSKNVAIPTNRWIREGMHLPQVRDLFTYNKNFNWKHQPDFDWSRVHQLLLKYWNPRKKIFLDKGPIYLFQARSIADEFKNSHFICLHRNPYSQIESYMRKSTMNKDSCIQYTIDTLQQQRIYLESMDSTFNLSYTHLTNSPSQTINELCEWMPALDTIRIKNKYRAHNILNKKIAIRNLDSHKIEQLADEDIKLINRRLSKHEDLMKYFGYEYIYRKN